MKVKTEILAIDKYHTISNYLRHYLFRLFSHIYVSSKRLMSAVCVLYVYPKQQVWTSRVCITPHSTDNGSYRTWTNWMSQHSDILAMCCKVISSFVGSSVHCPGIESVAVILTIKLTRTRAKMYKTHVNLQHTYPSQELLT